MDTITSIYILCITIYITVFFVIQNIINNNTLKELDKLQIDNRIKLNEITILKIHITNIKDTLLHIVKTIPFRGEKWMHEILKEELDKNMKLWDETAAKNADNITYADYDCDTESDYIETINGERVSDSDSE